MRGISLISVSVLILSLVLWSDQTLAGPANGLTGQGLSAPAGHSLPPGQVKSVLALRPLIDIAEGIAIDQRGNIFVSNTRLENDTRVCEILEIALDGTVTVFATLDPAVVDEFGVGVFGLAIDSRGDLYAALSSFDPATHGVWRIRRGGEAERLRGSRQMIQPNSITFDRRSNIYVTDSADGTIWRFPGAGRGKLWIRHALLAPDPNFGIGANGITFIPPRDLFVANTDLGLIARVKIKQDGNPGIPEIVAVGIELLTIDGLAADAQGNLHAVIAGASIFGTSPLVRVNPDTGEINSSTTEADAFDFPTNLTFGRGPLDHKSIYVVNSGVFPEERPEAAPGVIRVAIGVPGSPVSLNQAVIAEGPGQLGFPFPPLPRQVTESATVVRASVGRTGGSTGAVSVDYATVSGTATAGSDFTSTTGALTWGDGDTANKIISVAILDDAAVENDEDFGIRLSHPTGGATISIFGGILQVRILDDDPGLGLASTTATIGEAGGSVSFMVSRSGAASDAASVDYTTSSGSATAGSDFTSASGTLNWAAGDSAAKNIAVSITNDIADENNETFTVTLSNPSAGTSLGSNSTTTVTITDDDASGGGGGGGGGGGASGGGGGALDYLAMLCLACLAFPSRHRPFLLARGRKGILKGAKEV